MCPLRCSALSLHQAIVHVTLSAPCLHSGTACSGTFRLGSCCFSAKMLAASHSQCSFPCETCTIHLDHGLINLKRVMLLTLCSDVQELEFEEYARKGVTLTPELWLVKLMVGAIDSRWVAPVCWCCLSGSLTFSAS